MEFSIIFFYFFISDVRLPQIPANLSGLKAQNIF